MQLTKGHMMSLNEAEMRRTSTELVGNFELTGLSLDQVAADLGFTPTRVHHAMHLDGPTDPVDTWLLRDYLVQAVRDAGRDPIPFTILTERSKLKARMWFRLRKAPRHDFAAA
ncbi:hypothetical protein SAMN05428970_0249 [Agromyces sp. CF514]|uniref:DUF2316 family protein n=1 Tax=Agromyces sp. CF514 TaxID=1881031 RepID=UPI0008F1057C|nr:DUF2316 family protein [Agromyces sp. CF514]SFR67656.1 hypothetical protein SAMN05428970_0249 [Agromyces sp. CF514]